jgi:hypothetical protein
MKDSLAYYEEIVDAVVDVLQHEPEDLIDNIEAFGEAMTRALNETIYSMTIYRDDCWDIVKATGYDVFATHGNFGRPDSIDEAASSALWDLCYDGDYDFQREVSERTKLPLPTFNI